MTRFVLASGSPARLALLRAAGVEPEVVVSGVDEDAVTAESPAALVQVLASSKATSVADGLGSGDALVLGCDSLLELDGAALGKPGSIGAARERWQAMRGRTGLLHTGHCLIDTVSGRRVERTSTAEVAFADATDDEIELYCNTGEPVAVAGAFKIDGLAGWFIDFVRGEPHTVVGLSLPALRAMLRELDRSLTDIGYPAT